MRGRGRPKKADSEKLFADFVELYSRTDEEKKSLGISTMEKFCKHLNITYSTYNRLLSECTESKVDNEDEFARRIYELAVSGKNAGYATAYVNLMKLKNVQGEVVGISADDIAEAVFDGLRELKEKGFRDIRIPEGMDEVPDVGDLLPDQVLQD